MRPALTALLALALLTAPTALAAQQVVDPAVRSRTDVLLENERVLMVENTYEPGAVSEEHTHASPRAVYVVSGGILEMVAPDGSVSQIEVLRGQAMWRPAETHVVRNVGPTRVILVETEIRAGEDR